jgi:hypothetical protein
MIRLCALAALVVLSGCRTKGAPAKAVAPVTEEAVDPVQLEARARADLAAAETSVRQLEAEALSEPQRERLALAKALIADARAALDLGNAQRAAQLAAKALSLTQGTLGS